jgi:diguanylate cyclase (GGDEF)-like protein
MASDPANERTDGPRARWIAVHRWAIWGLSGRVIGPVLLVEATAVVVVVLGILGHPVPTAQQLQVAAVLCGLGIAHTEVSLAVERVRRRFTDGNYVDLASVWTFAAAVSLPSSYAAFVVVIVHLHLWWRAWRLRVPAYKQVFNTATVVLACVAAAAVLSYTDRLTGPAPEVGGHQLWALLVALLVFTTVNSCLVAGAIAVSMPEANLSKVFATWDENILEIATLCLGGLVAVVLSINGWLVPLVLPPLVVLHRAVLVRQLEEAARTDGKTGLLNAAAWHTQAERVLRRAKEEGPHGVLVLDLDHFKVVNDTHGHIAGDHVLTAVAGALRTEVRECDLVGRFGGEEFVVLLNGLANAGASDGGAVELETVAERIRRRVAGLRVEIPTPDGPLTVTGLSVSIGGALAPAEDPDLKAVLQAADTALYAAKRAGRNVVRLDRPMPAPSPSASSTPPAAAG